MSWKFWKREIEHKQREAIEERVTKSQITRAINSIHQEELAYLQAKLERIKKRREKEMLLDEIEDLEEEDEEDEGDDPGAAVDALNGSPESMLMNIVMQAMAAKGRVSSPGASPQSQNAPTPQPEAQPRANIPEERLRAIKAQIPKPWLKKLQAMSDEDILATARQYYPDHFDNIDEDSKARALLILREM